MHPLNEGQSMLFLRPFARVPAIGPIPRILTIQVAGAPAPNTKQAGEGRFPPIPAPHPTFPIPPYIVNRKFSGGTRLTPSGAPVSSHTPNADSPPGGGVAPLCIVATSFKLMT